MTFSVTRPCSLWGDDPRDDALFQAWEMLRSARQVPWSADESVSWRIQFEEHIRDACQRFAAHVHRSEAPGSALRKLAATRAVPQWLRAQFEEHTVIMGLLRQLMSDTQALVHAELEQVVQLSERAVLLEMRMAMHQNRLHELVAAERAPALAGR